MLMDDIPEPQERVSSAAVNYLTDIIDDGVGVPVEEILKMANTHHRAGVALQLKALMAAARMPRYRHPDETIEQFVNDSGTGLKDQLPGLAEKMMSAESIGFSLGEFIPCRDGDAWGFGHIFHIHPGDVEFTLDQETGRLGDVETGGDDPVPYSRLIHVVNNPSLSFGSPYGQSSAKRALSLWQASRIVMRQWTITAQRQATPLLHANIDKELADQKIYNDKGVCLKDKNGNDLVIPGIVAAKQELAKVQSNQNFLVTQGTEIGAINHQSNGQFFKDFAEYLDREILISLLVPETAIAVGRGGLGNSGLAQEHNKNLDLTIDSMLKQFQQQLMQKVVTPLIVWNFGEQEDYGSWEPIPEREEERVEIGRLIVDVLREPAVADRIDQPVLDEIRDRLVGLL